MRQRLKKDSREPELEKKSSTGQTIVSAVHRRRLRNRQDDGINPRNYATLDEYQHALWRSINPELYDFLVERAKKRMQVSNPGDPCEREAEEVAERVVRTNESDLKQKKSVMDGIYKSNTRASGETVTKNVEAGIATLGTGKPLTQSEREYFEPRFGADFSEIIIHNDANAHALAEELHARAITIGNNIVFNKNEYSSQTYEGKKLLAHELVHTAQNNSVIARQFAGPRDDIQALILIRQQYGVEGLEQFNDGRIWGLSASAIDYWILGIPQLISIVVGMPRELFIERLDALHDENRTIPYILGFSDGYMRGFGLSFSINILLLSVSIVNLATNWRSIIINYLNSRGSLTSVFDRYLLRTVWDRIIPTAADFPYTRIPATFQLRVRGRILWVNSNGTEHMIEYIGRFGTESYSTGLRSQIILNSFTAAVDEAMLDLRLRPPGRYEEIFGGWSLGIDTQDGIIYHAQPIWLLRR